MTRSRSARRGALAWAAVVIACGHPPEPPPRGDPAAAAPAPAPPADAPEASQEERLAAIQNAMNELDEAAQQCWAAAATERFDIEGELTLQIEIAPGASRASVVRDTARNTKLATCVVGLLSAYHWAPPLHGQTIQLPFKFRAPDGQNTIDRALVPWNGQARVSVAVLLDENNTGNDAASMFEIAIAAGASTGLRWADRAELWYFLGAGQVSSVAGGQHTVAAGDMMYAPRGCAREVAATAGDLHAVIVVVPGGREGAARSGALPNREVTGKSAAAAPTLLPAAAARPAGPAAIFAEPATIHDRTLAAAVVTLPAGTRLASHAHAGETELFYLLAGGGTLTVDRVELPLTPTSAAQIPRNTKHALVSTGDVRALVVYTPAGPEQHFQVRP